MTPETIEKFIEVKSRKNNAVNIHFKGRNPVKGVFIQLADYQELKSKNFWRIVSTNFVDEWRKTSDNSLARIFNGGSFTRLSD